MLAKALIKLLGVFDGVTLVFFPNYELTELIGKRIDADLVETRHRKLSIQARDLVGKKITIAAVAGGRLAEGTELVVNGKSLIEAIIVVTVPFERPGLEQDLKHAAYIRAYGKRNAQFLLQQLSPTANLIQMLGRAVRSEKDRAIHIILDQRVRTLEFFKHLPRHHSVDALISHVLRLRR